MKRLFTIAVVAMVASLTFAQAPLAKKKSASSYKLERMADMKALAAKAKEVKELQAVKAEKEALANQKGTSILRKNSVARGLFDSAEGKVVKSLMPGGFRSALAGKPYKSTARKTTTQEGNVTVTTDANGIITDVTGVEPKMYQRAATGTAYYPSGQSIYSAKQSGVVTVVEDGDNVYIKNPITRLESGAWVRGTKSGNVITVAARQPLEYNTSYGTTVSLRWGVIKATGELEPADDHADAFTFTVDGNVLTLEGTAAWTGDADAYYMAELWDDDNSASGYGDAETVLTYDPTYVAPSTELVTLPAGVEYTGWYINGLSLQGESSTKIKNRDVNVAFVDKDIYVQGISEDFPEAWVKGTVDGTTVTFEKFQYVGAYVGNDCWFVGAGQSDEAVEMKDAVATYDATAKTITFTDDILINANAFRVYYLAWYSEAVVSAGQKEYPDPIITEQTTTLPYLNTFETETEQNEAAIYDANEDGSTFDFSENPKGNKVARYLYNSTNTADDYLVFPGMELKAGKKYKVSVDATSYTSSYAERMEVVAGKEAKVSKLTIPVIAPTELRVSDFITLTNKEFSVDEDGVYYFAVHGISDPDLLSLFVDNFAVEELDDAAPATISDLKITADPQGANKAVVSFTVPNKTLAGDDITEDVKVTVKRGEVVVSEQTAAAGTPLEVADNDVPKAGDYTYSVTASYGEHVGEPAEASAYIGYDTPKAVTDVTIVDKSSSVDISWVAPTEGANGYIVNTADFKYNIYPVEMVEFWGMLFPSTDFEHPYATGVTGTSANVEFNTNEGEQGFTYFAVTAENTTGESSDSYGTVVTGTPYEIPFLESVAGGNLSYFWGTNSDDENYDLEGGLYIGNTASDDDGGSMAFVAKTAGWMDLQSGKIALAGAVNPVLTFDYSGDAVASLAVSVITPKGVKEMGTLTPAADFAQAHISLKEFANEDWVRVIVTGTFTAAGNVTIDRIRVYNELDNNLVAQDITAASSVSAGDDVTVNVTVENQGSKAAAAGAYTVDLYRNGEKVQSLPGTEIASDAKASFKFTEKTTVMSPSELVWNAVVEFDADEDKTNNTTKTIKTKIKATSYPVVTDLAGVQDGDSISLTWSEPDMNASLPSTVTDDFESYEGFTTSAGDWTFVDGDASEVGGFQGSDFNVDGASILRSLQSFWVHDVSDSDTWNQTFAANSGTKYLAAMFRYDDQQVNDWAISPILSGRAQTISFYARSYSEEYPEKIEILYSTATADTINFVTAKAAELVPGEWTEFTAELPEGAKYFAIRSCGSSNFMLQIDDVTYETTETFGDLAIVGYNVYRDGVKLNAEPVAEPAYTDKTATVGKHEYVVTVVYDKGESNISNIVTIDFTSGIDAIGSKAMRVYGANHAVVVAGAEGTNVAIYTADGKLVYAGEGKAETAVKVESGVYVVRVGNTVVKTVVR